VPASFDEAARELTLRAAADAGLARVTLLEEPQAACYAWIDSAGDAWRRRLRKGDLVLVCDVGGGTTDFSLILVGERDGDLSLERVAIGDHILLGGDNMDLALARLVQQRLEQDGHRVDTWQMQTLWHQCRVAKETLFAHQDRDEHPVTLLGKGSRLVGGTIRSALRRDDLGRVLLDGFFPLVGASEMPARRRAGGLQELGLPYAADPAITRHLGRFLTQMASGGEAASIIRRGPSGLACPTHVLFNGGVMKAESLRARIVEVLVQPDPQGIAVDPVHPHNRKCSLANADSRLLEIEIDEASVIERTQLIRCRIVFLLDRRYLPVKAAYGALSARGGDRICQRKSARHYERQAEVVFRNRALLQVRIDE